MQKVGKKNGEDSPHAEEEVEVAAAAKEGRVDCSAPGSTTGLDYWPLLVEPASVERSGAGQLGCIPTLEIT